MQQSEATTARALARHRELLAEADRERRLALAESTRAVRAAELRRAIAGLGARQLIPSTPTTASATT